jgi:arginine transport system substrate-binding protein
MLKKMIAIGAAVVLYLVCSPLQAAIPQTINFETEATFPPFEYIDSSGQVKGFEIDLVNAMCQQMKVKCTYSNQPWVSLIPSLKLGKFQAIISAMSITAERQLQVDFTHPYFNAPVRFIVPVGSKLVISPEGLKGKVVGVQIGTTSSKYLEAKYGKIVTTKTYPNQQEALLDLVAGRVDTVLGETPVTADWLRQRGMDKKYVFTGPVLDDPEFFGVGYGIAVKKGDKELLDAFNQALAEIKTNGTWQKIVDAHFKE